MSRLSEEIKAARSKERAEKRAEKKKKDLEIESAIRAQKKRRKLKIKRNKK